MGLFLQGVSHLVTACARLAGQSLDHGALGAVELGHVALGGSDLRCRAVVLLLGVCHQNHLLSQEGSQDCNQCYFTVFLRNCQSNTVQIP